MNGMEKSVMTREIAMTGEKKECDDDDREMNSEEKECDDERDRGETVRR